MHHIDGYFSLIFFKMIMEKSFNRVFIFKKDRSF